MKKKLLTLACLALTAIAMAQPQQGKVYNLKNVGKGNSLALGQSLNVYGSSTDQSSKAQLWYVQSVSGDAFQLRNVATGKYLQGNNNTSNAWSVTDDAVTLEYATSNGSYAIRQKGHSNGYGYLHLDGWNNAVSWTYSGNNNTLWTFNEVSVDQSVIDNVLNVQDNKTTYQTALDNLFEDASCTTLKSTYTGYTKEQMKANSYYGQLSATLQDMVLKALTKNWEEANGDPTKSAWESTYAKKYRVQLYEPYNEPVAAANALGLNQHTNLNNPTGIYADEEDMLYIMVEGEIKDGASLYLASHTGHSRVGGYSEGIELKQDLNIIPCITNSSNFCINYVVHTFDTSDGKKGMNARKRKLSGYSPLKIHIEGGHINGYYNKVGDALYTPDTNANWDYIEQRATQTDVIILGKYMTLQFPLLDANTVDGDNKQNKGMATFLNEEVKVEDVINEWDNVMLWQRLLLGVLDQSTIEANAKKSPYSTRPLVFEYSGADAEYGTDYGDYYNVHGLSFGTPTGYMYGSGDHCGYNYNTMYGVIRELPTNAGSHWGPGHEIGHQHQNLLTVNGLTEVTNNLFANVVLWYFGETTSRVNGSEGSLSNVLAAYNTPGSDFFTNNIWAMTHMYYKLFLYYHVLGNNTKFYPRLFEMLRQDPMSKGYAQSGATTLLHFYKKCCLAAGEDLTEFFRAYGFFRVMDNRLVGDYSNSVYTQTQEDIDAAIAEVKAREFPANISVLFINDATGETIKSHKGNDMALYDGFANAEVGSYASFDDNATNGEYTFTSEGNNVTMDGEGSIGFALYNDKGEIIGFSDKKSFKVSDECAAMLAFGQAELKIVNADGSETEVENSAGEDRTAMQRAVLSNLLAQVKDILDMTDETGKKVGYYHAAALTDLQTAYNTAKPVYDNEEVLAYEAVYNVLNNEFTKVKNNAYALIQMVEGNAYRVTNAHHTGHSLSVNDSKNGIGETTDENSDKQKWYFEASGEAGRWYVKNKSTQTYAKSLAQDGNLDVSAETTADAYAYELRNMGGGVFALVSNSSMHWNGGTNVIGWGADAGASKWTITAVEVNETAAAYGNLQTLMAQTEELLAQMGEVSEQRLALTESNYKSNAECKDTQYGDQFTSYSVLCDNDPNTFFHSDYSNQAPKEYHYIRMDVGSGKELMKFKMHYTTRGSGNACAPTSVVIEGSNNDSDWTELMAVSSGLPTANNKSHTFDVLGNGTAYRYVRVVVKTTSGEQESNGYQYFVMSELGLSKEVATPVAEYATLAQQLQNTHDVLAYLKETVAADATKDQCTTAYNTLKTQYDALVEAKKTADNKPLDDKKAELKSLMDQTKDLMDQCGTVKYFAGGPLALQTTNENGAFYLSTNAPEPAEGAIENLLDGDNTSFFHSTWHTAIGDVHHLMVNVADVDITKGFNFTYFCHRGPFPYEIKVYGATDKNGAFELFRTFSKDDATNALPTSKNTVWTSDDVVPAKAYKYLRFDVTNSGGDDKNATPQGEYCFVMTEFGISVPQSITVTLNGVGNVTEELLLATYNQYEKASATHTYANTIGQVEQAITALQGAYDELNEAANAAPRFRITDNAGNVFEGRYEGEKPVFNGVQYTLANEVQDGNLYSADITFTVPFAISGPEATNPLMISSFNNNFKWYVSGNNVKVEKETEKVTAGRGVTSANVTTHLWTIHPTITGDNTISFQIKNLATGLYIYTESAANSHTSSAVTMSETPTVFTLGSKNGGVEFINSHAKRLSVNSSGDGKGEQFLGTWDSHNGTAIMFPTPSYNVTITAAKAATLYTPIAVSIPEGVTAKYVKSEISNIGSTGILYYTKLNGTIPANTAVVLIGNAATYTFNAAASDETVEQNVLFGYDHDVVIADSDHKNTGSNGSVYALANLDNKVAFYHFAKSKYTAGKAYLDVSALASATAGIRMFNIFDEETETGITETENGNVNTENVEIFDLSGRRVQKAQKGVFVVDGKKVIR